MDERFRFSYGVRFFYLNTSQPVTEELIRKRADSFYRHRNQLYQKASGKHRIPNTTLKQAMDRSPKLPDSLFEEHLKAGITGQLSVEEIEITRQRLQEIIRTINSFPPAKRFFILQTIDGFNTSQYAAKVVPALLSLEDPGQQQLILEFIFATFNTLKKNVETIISIPELFPQASLHVERGALYALTADLAKAVVALFTGDYLSRFDRSNADMVLVSQVMEALKKSGKQHQQTSHLIARPPALRERIIHYISVLQTHDALWLYAKKRHLYYTRFLKQIHRHPKISPFALDIASLILAACLISNQQLQPEDELIARMISVNTCAEPETQTAYHHYVEQLTPTTVLAVISDYKQTAFQITSDQGILEQDRSPAGRIKSMLGKLTG